MKIIHIISGLGIGGAENTLFNLINFSKDSCHHMVISLSKKNFYEKKLRNIDVKVINLDFKKSFFLNFINLIKIIKKNNPDIIQSWMYHAEFLTIFIRMMMNNKIYWNLRNSTPYSNTFKLKTKLLVFINSIFSHIIPNKIISCSTKASDSHIKIGYCRKKIINIFNGVDTKKFKIKKKNNQKNIKIGCVARWHSQKDHINLFKSLQLLIKNNFTDWRCFLAGKGLDQNNSHLTELIKRYKLKKYIKLMGPLSNIEKFYNKLDILILPSKDGEGFPNVLAEAYASGIMCISTNVGDARRIIIDKNYLVQPSNEKKLYMSMARMLKDNNLKNYAYKSKLRHMIKVKFSINKMIKNYVWYWVNG